MNESDYYKIGFKHAIEIIEMMGKDDNFEECAAMVVELKKIADGLK